jgi:hypothetical protein
MQTNRTILAVSVSAIVLAILGGILWTGRHQVRPPEPVSATPLPDDLKALRADAQSLQAKKEWCPANEKWKELKESLEGKPEFGGYLQEANANQQTAERRCNPDETMVGPGTEIKVPKQPDGPLSHVSEADIIRDFPQDKRVRSLGLMDVTGRGSNQVWVFRSDAYFVYKAFARLETRILENNGTSIEFEVTIPEVSQILTVSNKTVQFAAMDSPILATLWDQIEATTLEPMIPGYLIIPRVFDMLNTVDPIGKRMLTRINAWLNAFGFDLASLPEAQLTARFDQLAGHKVRLVYVPDFGIQTIEVLEGDLLPKDDLLSFARNSGVLTDYVVSEVLRTEVGKTFEVDARNLVRMIGLNYDVDVEGAITLKREEDKGGLAIMSVVGGEVRVKGNVDGIRKEGTLIPRKGTVEFDKNNLFVSWAQMEWKIDLDWVSNDHLLFGTKLVRDLEVKSHYGGKWISNDVKK